MLQRLPLLFLKVFFYSLSVNILEAYVEVGQAGQKKTVKPIFSTPSRGHAKSEYLRKFATKIKHNSPQCFDIYELPCA